MKSIQAHTARGARSSVHAGPWLLLFTAKNTCVIVPSFVPTLPERCITSNTNLLHRWGNCYKELRGLSTTSQCLLPCFSSSVKHCLESVAFIGEKKLKNYSTQNPYLKIQSPGWGGSVDWGNSKGNWKPKANLQTKIACKPKAIPSQDTCLGCRPGPQWGVHEGQPHTDISLPSPLSINK